MKKKLLAAMLLLTVHINGMENPIADPRQPGDKWHRFYLLQSDQKGNEVLKTLNKVLNENVRTNFFNEFVQMNNNATLEDAALSFIRSAAMAIIGSDVYSDKSAFYCALIEKLNPITWKFIEKVQRQQIVL